MNMQYRKGEFVGFVDVASPVVSVPVPQRWYILRVTPGRDARVMQALARRGISAYSPVVVRVIDRRLGNEARRPHLGRRIVKPMLPGIIFVPDFELDNPALRKDIDDVHGLFNIGDCLASLAIEDMQIIRQIESSYSTRLGQRKYALQQLVRIVSGPFANLIGKIERLDSSGRLRVFLDAVMRGAHVDVTEALIEPVVVRKRPKTVRLKRKT